MHLTGCRLLEDDAVIILGSSNYIHHHTCHVNANTLTGTRDKVTSDAVFGDVSRKCVIGGPESLS